MPGDFLAEIKHILEPFYLQNIRTQGWGSEGGDDRHGILAGTP
jgi:hypothetical protein